MILLKTYCTSKASTAVVVKVNGNNEIADLAPVISWSSCDGVRVCLTSQRHIWRLWKQRPVARCRWDLWVQESGPHPPSSQCPSRWCQVEASTPPATTTHLIESPSWGEERTVCHVGVRHVGDLLKHWCLIHIYAKQQLRPSWNDNKPIGQHLKCWYLKVI